MSAWAWQGLLDAAALQAASLQYQRPNADLAATGWSPTPSTPTTLYDKVNEVTPSDADYISATAS